MSKISGMSTMMMTEYGITEILDIMCVHNKKKHKQKRGPESDAVICNAAVLRETRKTVSFFIARDADNFPYTRRLHSPAGLWSQRAYPADQCGAIAASWRHSPPSPGLWSRRGSQKHFDAFKNSPRIRGVCVVRRCDACA